MNAKEKAVLKIEKRQKERWQGLPQDEIARRSLQVRNSIYRIDLKQRATETERIVMEFLESENVRFMFQKGFFKPFHRIVDFYLPKRRIIIEIDGGYHAQVAALDAKKDRSALARGFRTLRITNEQVLCGDFKAIILSAL